MNRKYTYRNGKKVNLTKEPNQFVVREKPEKVAKKGITTDIEKVSFTSTKVTDNDIHGSDEGGNPK